jgi:hypothetical protein
MGLFDTIHVAHPAVATGYDLPAGEYQTKDLICYLRNYELRSDGSLWLTDSSEGDSAIPERFMGTGEVRMYNSGGEWSSYWINGQSKHLVCIERKT